MYYNEALANEKGLTENERLELDATYILLSDALNHPERYDDVVSTVRDLEYTLQKQWGFPQDARFHRYQIDIKGCTCPRLDNYELFGHTEDRYATSDCPFHWKFDK